MTGNCDNGYSCAYTYNMAWKTPTQPLPPISNPRNLFERLFGSDIVEPPAAHARRLAMRRSILDQVMGSTQHLEATLGPTDKRKLDEYLSSVREIEKQVEKSEKEGMVIDPGIEKPFGVPPEFPDYFRLMSDMMLIAFKADITRVSTLMVGREGSTRAYPEIGVPDGHHPLTHHMGNMSMLDKVREINALHVKLFAEFLAKMKATKEGIRTFSISLSSSTAAASLTATSTRTTSSDHPRRPRWRRRQPWPAHHLPARDARLQPLRHNGGTHGRSSRTFGRLHGPPSRSFLS